MHTIKINRALSTSTIGTTPGAASDMLNAVPESIIAALPSRLLAELLDAQWALACRSKELANREAIDEGAMWDARGQRLVELAA